MKNTLFKENFTIEDGASIINSKLKINDGITIIKKAILGGETTLEDIKNWIETRLFPNVVEIDKNGYSEMCINALKRASSTVASDYGSSRQRDLGQIWADTTRGYLGEYAFKLFLKKNFNIVAELGHNVGQMDDYLNFDIHSIIRENNEVQKPKKNIGIKTTKWNGIWLDIPGAQFKHSDIHIFVKVGTGRDHLFGYFKELSVFKDKVLKKGIETGVLTDYEANTLFTNLPSLESIPAYIVGFVTQDIVNETVIYGGKKGRKNYTITSWKGPYSPEDLLSIAKKENAAKVSFEGIKDFSNQKRYLFNSGNLKWKYEDWLNIINTL